MDPSQQLSTNYTLGDLCVTSHKLNAPNLPSDPATVQNMTYLADDLENLTTSIGPFTVPSAFRTAELQALLVAEGEPATTKLSFHEVGRAADIIPTTMDINTYFGMILANDNLRNLFAEIAIKPAQGSIHLAVNVPGDTRTPKITGLTADQTYAQLTPDQVQAYIDQVSPQDTLAIADEGSDQGSGELIWLLGGAALLAMWFITVQKS
jgi:hypothetical protein